MKNKVGSYFVVEALTSWGLSDEVMKYIKMGYQPLGGAGASVERGVMVYFQSMVKYEE